MRLHAIAPPVQKLLNFCSMRRHKTVFGPAGANTRNSVVLSGKGNEKSVCFGPGAFGLPQQFEYRVDAAFQVTPVGAERQVHYQRGLLL